MARKFYSPERVAEILRKIDTAIESNTPVQYACLDAGIAEQTYYRWKAKYAGLTMGQVGQVQVLRRQNTQLRRRIEDLTQEKSILQSLLNEKT